MGILGASGCGKSMTLKCIAGIEKPDEGRIVLDGKVLFDSEKRIDLKPQRRNVGYLFQNYALFPKYDGGRKYRNRHERKERAEKDAGGKTDRKVSAAGSGEAVSLRTVRRSAAAGGAGADLKLQSGYHHAGRTRFSALDGYLKDTLQLEMQEVLAGIRERCPFRLSQPG